jgi:hypothetical protein
MSSNPNTSVAIFAIQKKARWGVELSVFMILEMFSPTSDFLEG